MRSKKILPLENDNDSSSYKKAGLLAFLRKSSKEKSGDASLLFLLNLFF